MKALFDLNNNSDSKVTEIFQTYDYGKFKILNENRDTIPLHVKRLAISFEENYLISPITINEKMEVIDGQNRLKAAMKTGKPIYYFIAEGYGLNEVKILNVNTKNWNRQDHLNSLAAQGIESYVNFQKFMTDFPDFGIQACERILTGLLSGKQGSIDGQKVVSKDFEEGKLFIPNLARSYKVARQIKEFKPFYKNYYRATFVSAMLGLLDSKIYNHSEMIKKLTNNPRAIENCISVSQYRDLLEEVYNYRRSEKVSFRYL